MRLRLPPFAGYTIASLARPGDEAVAVVLKG